MHVNINTGLSNLSMSCYIYRKTNEVDGIYLKCRTEEGEHG